MQISFDKIISNWQMLNICNLTYMRIYINEKFRNLFDSMYSYIYSNEYSKQYEVFDDI